MSRRAIRPRASWAIVPLAVLVGAGAGYGVGVAADAEPAAAAIGAAAGLLLGGLILFAWLRTHPRVLGPGGAYKLTGIPTTALDDISREAASGLLRRWLALSASPLVRVAIVPATPDLAHLAGDTAAWLHGLQADGASEPASPRKAATVGSAGSGDPSAAPRTQWKSRWSTREPKPSPRLVMLATGLKDPELVHEDLVVMLAEDGMTSRGLTDAADRLETLGRRPEWMLVVRSPVAAQKRFGAKATNGARPAGARAARAAPRT